MNEQATSLTDAQWALIAELLQRERRELPGELHHSQTPSVRDGLRLRLEQVDAILSKLGQPVG
jgi:hypothetical protein